MLGVSPASHAHQIRNAADKLGVLLPKQFTAALDAAHKLTEDTAQYDGVTAQLNNQAIELLLAGKPPEQDATLQRLAIRRVLSQSGIRVAGVDRSNHMILTAIKDCADLILTGWRDALADDVDILHRAAEAIDVEDIDAADTKVVARTGNLDLLASALSAHARLSTAAHGLRTIALAAGMPTGREHQPLTLSDATLDQAEAINTAARPGAPTPWTVVRCGAALSLPTLTELRERVTSYNHARAERQRRFEEARKPDGFDVQRRQAATI